MAKKIELLHTTYDESGNIESQEVVHPLTSPDCIIMENGKTLDEVMGDGIATPTITHEGTSFQVGVGDSNIEVVDSDVAGMTIKGQSYQNILPKPTTLIMETDEKEFKINDKIDSNIIIDDNIAEIATVKGKTIVNTVQEESASEYVVMGQNYSGQEIIAKNPRNSVDGMTLTNLLTKNPRNASGTWYDLITINGEVTDVNNDSYRIKDTNTIRTLQPGTYLIQFKVVSVSGTSKINSRTQLVDGSQVIQEEYPSNVSATVGINRIKINLTKECNRIGLFYNAGQNSSATITEAMVFEYNDNIYNLDIPYFEGTKYFEANIKGVTLQGQTLVNTIQEPSDYESVVIGEDLSGQSITIEQDVKGLEGMTLVNVSPTRNVYVTAPLSDTYEWANKQFAITANVKKGKTYLILIKKYSATVDNFSSNPNVVMWVKEDGIEHGTWFKDKLIYTIPDEDFTKMVIRFHARVGSIIDNSVSAEDIMIIEYQEGLENLDIPYFEGTKYFDYSTPRYINGATLEGQTLVNLITNKSRENSHYTDYNLSYIDKTKTYFVKITSTKAIVSIGFIVNDSTWNSEVKCEQITNGYVIIKPNETLEVNNLRIVTSDSETSYTLTTMIIEYQEGMENWDIPYFEGMQSVKMPVLTITGKNLFNKSFMLGNIDGNGNVVQSTINIISNPIKVNGNRTYSVSGVDGYITNRKLYYIEYDENMKLIKAGVIFPFTTSSNCKYLRMQINGTTDVEGINSLMQIEESLTSTSYEPYKSNILTVNEPVELRGIGDIKDELDLVTGELTQRIGEVVLDGNENWSSDTNGSGATRFYNSLCNDIYIQYGTVSSSANLICNNFNHPIGNIYTDTNNSIQVVTPNGLYFICTECSTIEEWRTWLKNNKTIIQYALATPIIKTIDLQVTDQDGNELPYPRLQTPINHTTTSSDRLTPIVNIPSTVNYDTIIKPSTQYTLRFNQDEVNTDNPLTVNLGGIEQVVTSNHFTMTTPSTLTHNQLQFGGKGNVVSKVQVIEGDVTGIEYPYFEGMNSVGQTVLKNCLPSLLNFYKDDHTQKVNAWFGAGSGDFNYSIDGNGLLSMTMISTGSRVLRCDDLTKVKPNTKYLVKIKYTNSSSNTINFGYVDTDIVYQHLATGVLSDTWFVATTPSSDKMIGMWFGVLSNVQSGVKLTFKDIQMIEYQDNMENWYIPYFEDEQKISDVKMKVTGKNLFPNFHKTFTSTTQYRIDQLPNGFKVTTLVEANALGIYNNLMIDNLEPNTIYTIGAKITISDSRSGNRLRVYDVDTQKSICYINATGEQYYQRFIVPNSGKIGIGYYFISNVLPSGATTSPIEPIGLQITYEDITLVKGNSSMLYEPYHEPIIVQQDVDSIPLTSDMFEQGAIDNAKAIIGMSYQQIPTQVLSNRLRQKTIIPIKQNATYTLNHKGYVVLFDENGCFVMNGDKYDVSWNANSPFTIPANIHYIGLCLQSESAITPSDLDSMNLILQEVPQEIVLRGIGDVKDELDLTRGEYIQRIGEVVLDGYDSRITMHKAHNNGHISLRISLDGNQVKPIKATLTDSILCDKFKVFTFIKLYQYGDISVAGNMDSLENIYICISSVGLNTSTMKDICKYFEVNPTKIQYVLQTPIIHKVNLTNTKVIPSYATETHYETITPLGSLIPNITIPSTLNYNVAIKPSTEYTIRANTSDNLTVDLGGTTGTLSNGKVTLTTPATLTHNEVKFSGTGKVKELMVVEGNEIKDNVPFFNGMKDVQMGGIKLVNIARGATIDDSGRITVNNNKTMFTYKNAKSTDTATIIFSKDLVKPNTLYTVYCKIPTNTIDREIKVQIGDGTTNYLNIPSNYTGIYKALLTTPKEIEHVVAFYFRSSATLGQVVIQNPMIIEGDWTHLDEIPFIESEMIIDQPIIRSQGKNLFDISRGINYTWHSEYTINGDGSVSVMPTLIDGVAYVQSEFFFLEVGKTYTVSWNTSGNVLANHVWLAGTTNSPYGTSNTFTVVEGKNKLTLAMYVDTSSLENVAIFKPQIEEGSTATPYEPYKHQTLYSNRVIGYEDGCYYIASNGNKITTNSNLNSVKVDVEGLSIAYISKTSSNYVFWDKDGVFISGKATLDTAGGLTDKDGFITVPSNAKYLTMAVSNKDTNRLYTDTTVTGDLPLRSLPNGVCDTLNLVTGEYVQRVREVVLDGSQSITIYNREEDMVFTKTIAFNISVPGTSTSVNLNLHCTSMPTDTIYGKDSEGIFNKDSTFRVSINKDKLITQDVNGFKQYLSQNPITVQYELGTPIVRKLEFTTKGNYREQVLDGSETWAMDAIDNTKTVRMTKKNVSPLQNPLYDTALFTDDYHVRARDENHGTYEYIGCIGNGIYINIYQSKVNELSVQGCTQWLSHNPIKVGYITSAQSSESYSNIHKPIFFNDVDVQYLPNNVGIQPQLTLQARTRNSYVMDMMKANTKYSINLLNSNGNIKIDGTSYALANNRTFISPSTLTNKELIISGQWYEPMIIEGDVTGKNLPYFKGILSSYHDVDEIELYSVSKNLFDINNLVRINSASHATIIGNNVTFNCTSPFLGCGDCWIPTEVGKNYTVSLGQIIGSIGATGARIEVRFYNSLPTPIESGTLPNIVGSALTTRDKITTTALAQYMRITISNGEGDVNNEVTITNIQVEKSSSVTSYTPHSHNTTLIEMPTRLETVKVVRPKMISGAYDGDKWIIPVQNITVCNKDVIPVQPNMEVTPFNGATSMAVNYAFYDINKKFIISYTHNHNGFDGRKCIVPDNAYFMGVHRYATNTDDFTIYLKEYKPIQLNSLPNGVCDEIIMKPNSNKAQLVQRVGKVVLDGSEDWSWHENWSAGDIVCAYTYVSDKQVGAFAYSDKFEGLEVINALYPQNPETGVAVKECIRYNAGTAVIYVFIKKARLGEYNYNGVKEYLKDNPLTVYYQCNPVTHEIQLKGYPHVYENGTVILNTDVPHQTFVSYNVDQEQLITNQNEVIIRHDQQIDDLYYYIELYLEEIYQMELFRMQVELSL